ncbi:uncharacterized protein [Triticum aestivum]|uniref:uncharacterized protein n=1 Tax=Triticum aestivum TaxID=4565 RepID=UPI001D0223C5|nr:uncharacterized protein LOC123147284 [Triticum aestivum]
MEDARGYRGIPAFGEWNYGDGDDWPVLAQRFSSPGCTSRFRYTKPASEREQVARGVSLRSESGTTTAMATPVAGRRPSSTSASSLPGQTNHSNRNSLVTTVASSPWGSSSTRLRGKPGRLTLGPMR